MIGDGGGRAVIAGAALDDRSSGTGLAAIGAVHVLAAAVGWLSLRVDDRRDLIRA